ncbi:MAG: lysylphosphatidylglycerol synthase transmembrane domain-containing protein [Pirellulaceae bacterium]|nr:lysylphosphatidylglycerol synthase transmembrane domain-containing protein [Pirellulaceae bacterium]MDP7020592.1 lysylphosphatidylglycerol synthase transmembrane domain-containing protein [Pirellulaceae bacterium]
MAENDPSAEAPQPAAGVRRTFDRKSIVKLIIRLVVLVLVAWGISRTVRSAWRELDQRQTETNEQLAILRAKIAAGPADSREVIAWRREVEQLERQSFSPWRVDWRWAALSGVFYLVGLLPNWWFWRESMRALGGKPRLAASLAAYFIGHLGKYVPGKAMVVVLRSGLVKDERTGATVAATAVFVETLTMMAVGAAVSTIVLLVVFPHWLMILLACGVLVATGLPTAPPIFRRVVRFLKVRKADPELESRLEHLDWPLMGKGWLAIGAGWVCLGLSLWATLRSLNAGLGGGLASELPLLIAAVALAMVLGFISLIPGGAFVREWVVTTLLATTYGAAAALAAAVWLRLNWLMSELVISIILYGCVARSPRSSDPPSPRESG